MYTYQFVDTLQFYLIIYIKSLKLFYGKLNIKDVVCDRIRKSCDNRIGTKAYL